ncbi:MAG: ABC transporter ATP-binding protein/permease [Lachnospiraceae bacterium]|nr:ABC transporter ATP-binding protein/permease [Lachnospiraceae bacterium]
MSDQGDNYDVLDMSGDGMSTEKAKDSKRTLRRLLTALKPQRWQMMIAFVFAVGGVLLNLRAPLLFADAINEIFIGIMPAMMGIGPVHIDFVQLGTLAAILIGIYILSAVITYFQEFIMASVSQKLVLVLRENVGEKLARVPLRYYDNHKKGEILSRVTNDLERVNEVMNGAIMRIFTSFVTIIGALILMFRIHWILTLISIGTILVGLIITALVGMKSAGYFANRQKSLGIFNTKIEENFSGQVEIKTFTLEKRAKEETNAAAEQLYRDDKKAQFIMFAIMPIIRLFNQIGYVAIAGLGASFVINGRISIGQIMAFFQYIQMSQEPLTEASYVINSLQSALASVERVFEVMDEAEDIQDVEDAQKISNPKGDICFEHVQFGYGAELLMHDVSFQAKAGQKIAIVGPTGAGKTTLVNLLMRFYELNGGRIKIDGIDITRFEREYLRSLFGMVLQDAWLFEGTIAENIAYGCHQASDAEIVEAARIARADYFIRTLPKGYSTVMNDENASLSQGEKQLVCIARAILANPPMLLLDEATSSVDTRTEVHIQKAMDTLMKGRTSFIIAHRLSTIKNADTILVMNQGDIVEMGSHKELLAKNGMYYEIYRSQFAS